MDEQLTLAKALIKMRKQRDLFSLVYVTIETANGELIVLPQAAWVSGLGCQKGDRLICTMGLGPVKYTDRGWELYYNQDDGDD